MGARGGVTGPWPHLGVHTREGHAKLPIPHEMQNAYLRGRLQPNHTAECGEKSLNGSYDGVRAHY